MENRDYDFKNPFYFNYLFSKKDNKRFIISRYDKIKLFFKPMYVQLTSDGMIAKYKIGNDGAIYLFELQEKD